MTHTEYLKAVWGATTIEDLRAIEAVTGSSREEEKKLAKVYYALGINPVDPRGVYGKIESLGTAQAKGEGFYQSVWEEMKALDPSRRGLIIGLGAVALVGVIIVAGKRRIRK